MQVDFALRLLHFLDASLSLMGETSMRGCWCGFEGFLAGVGLQGPVIVLLLP